MSDLHFLRPWWLLALIPVAVIGRSLWLRTDPARPWRDAIAPHLLPHLLIGGKGHRAIAPAVALIAGWAAALIALAGPTWRREPAPFAQEEDVLAIVLRVTPSMRTQDIQPSRLARAVEKIHDLLALRPGESTALVAYAGSAHRVMPPTTDAGIIVSFASELAPDVMPRDGDSAAEALGLAARIIKDSGRRGWILWIADAVAADQLKAIRNDGAVRAPVSVLAVAGAGPELESVRQGSSAIGAEFVPVSPDDSDIRKLASNSRYSESEDEKTERWQDAGYWIVPAIALLNLLWFRPGWVAQPGGAS